MMLLQIAWSRFGLVWGCDPISGGGELGLRLRGRPVLRGVSLRATGRAMVAGSECGGWGLHPIGLFVRAIYLRDSVGYAPATNNRESEPALRLDRARCIPGGVSVGRHSNPANGAPRRSRRGKPWWPPATHSPPPRFKGPARHSYEPQKASANGADFDCSRSTGCSDHPAQVLRAVDNPTDVARQGHR
jgi:hypothetical protein